jgi:hypothetical protein
MNRFASDLPATKYCRVRSTAGMQEVGQCMEQLPSAYLFGMFHYRVAKDLAPNNFPTKDLPGFKNLAGLPTYQEVNIGQFLRYALGNCSMHCPTSCIPAVERTLL